VAQENLRAVGLCDLPYQDMVVLGDATGRNVEPPEFSCSGLGHASWYSRIRLDHELMVRFPEDLEPPGYLDEAGALRFRIASEVARRHPGYWPNSYLSHYTHPERYAELNGASSGPVLEPPPPRVGPGSFLVLRLLQALAGEDEADVVLNVANRGMMSLFRSKTVLEASVHFERGQVVRRPLPPIPAGEEECLLAIEKFQRLSAAAILARDVEALHAALEAHPLVDGKNQAEAIFDRARSLYRELMPLA
ncbi:MAG: hypothetical protein ACNA8W_20870, partial [Bradymonadaceae bacterium]